MACSNDWHGGAITAISVRTQKKSLISYFSNTSSNLLFLLFCKYSSKIIVLYHNCV